MKIFIDDERNPPDDSWMVARTSKDALRILEAITWDTYNPVRDQIEEISFDHDLGGDDTTIPVVKWMCEYNVWPKRVYIHSANPVGRENIAGWVNQFAPEGTLVRGY